MTAVPRARSRVALPALLLALLATLAALALAGPVAPAHADGGHHEQTPPSPPDDLKVLVGGATELVLDPAAVQALAGIPIRPIGAASATEGGFAFPISVGIVHEG